MASGEISSQADAVKLSLNEGSALPVGTVITSSGRLSATRFPGQAPSTPPFKRGELIALDDTLRDASELAHVRFSIYIGNLGPDPVADARTVLAKAPEPRNSALVAVSPNTHDVVVVSGSDVAHRINDRVAGLGVTAAVTSFKQGNLIDGLIAAIRVMATAAART